MDYKDKIEIPKLLILTQKRSGSHYLQHNIRCASLTGVTFMDNMKTGNEFTKDLYKQNNGLEDQSVQLLRYHNFSTRDRYDVAWYSFSVYLVNHTQKIVVLFRKDMFMHALTDYFNDNLFERQKKLDNSWDDWTDYREAIVQEHEIDFAKFDFCYQRAFAFYNFFYSLWSAHKDKVLCVYYEDLPEIETVIGKIDAHARFYVGTGEGYRKWRAVRYELMPRFENLKKKYESHIV